MARAASPASSVNTHCLDVRVVDSRCPWDGVQEFLVFHHVRHPLEMGAKEVGEFLTNLAVEGHVAASTQNQALSALLFLYREVRERDFGQLDNLVWAQKPKRLPEVFSPEEVMAIIEKLNGLAKMRTGTDRPDRSQSPFSVRWLMGMLLYGGGLRLLECLRLRVKDLDFGRLQVVIRDGKGEKDLVTLLAEAAVEPLQRTSRRHWGAGDGLLQDLARLSHHI